MKNMNEEEWKADKKMMTWMSEHFAHMAVGAIWMPENAGVTYQKTNEKELTLVEMVDTDGCRENHQRMKSLTWDLGYTVLDSEANLVPEPRNQMEEEMRTLEMKRKIAQGWKDKDGTLLVDMNLDAVYPKFVEETEVLMDNGDTRMVEVWEYRLLNPNTGKTLSIDPDDYHLMMGDDRFMQFMNERGELLRAMDRAEMIHAIDEGINARLIGTTDPETGERVPQWMYGTYCKVTPTLGEEE